jgi:hypothetical protein
VGGNGWAESERRNAWASSTITGFTAFVLFLLLLARSQRRRVLGLLVVLVTFFSLDDSLQIHERLRYGGLGLDESVRVVWPIVYLPLLAAVSVLLWSLAAETLEGKRIMRAGLVMLAAAVACELVSAGLVQGGYGRGTVLYDLEVAVEEGLELAGWIFLAAGFSADLLARAALPEPRRPG